MKRILFLLSLSGILLANQSIVITFGTEDANTCSSNTAKGIFSNPDSLTYNIVTTKQYFNPNNLVDTSGSNSSISVSFASSTYGDDSISTKNGTITSISNDKNGSINSIFGEASIKGVLMSTNDSQVVITFKGLSSGTYTLYALGARGSKGITDANTSYTVIQNQNISELSSSILAYGDSAPQIKDNIISATTYNTKSNVSNWVLMEYNFTINDDDSSIVYQSYGHDGNVAAIAILSHSIPEPTTSTMSLLALAALAIRRRRK